MRRSFQGFVKIALILMLTVGVIFSCCSCVMQSGATAIIPTLSALQQNEYSFVKKIDFSTSVNARILQQPLGTDNKNDNVYIVCKGYSNFLDKSFSQEVITRVEWLSILIEKCGYELITDIEDKFEHIKDKNYYDGSEYFVSAIENGMLYRGGAQFNNYSPATREFVSTTIYKTVGYKSNFELDCEDEEDVDDDLSVACALYLGYLELDENDCFNPNAQVTSQQLDDVLSELELIKTLKGKTVMTFGDSIMHGDGNEGVGVSELISQKYLTDAIDYSIGGATFGYAQGREQISNQILEAISKHEKADFILINGGTNDMRNVEVGEMADDFQYGEHGREYFANGMEYALGLLRDNYPNTPVVYVRAHDMEFSLERNELYYGSLALDICSKWDIEVADVFNDTDFDAHDKDIRREYTAHTRNRKEGDSVHPNRAGYYKYYIPLVVEKIIKLNVTG